MMRLALAVTMLPAAAAAPTCTDASCCVGKITGMCYGNTHDAADKIIGSTGYSSTDFTTCEAGTTLKADPHLLTQPTTGAQAACCIAVLCNEDFYAASAGTCTACSAGRSNAAGDSVATTGFAATTCDETCNEDFYAASAGTCTACPAGQVNAAGDSVAATGFAATTCDECAANFYAASAGTCTACPAGETNAAGDSVATTGFAATACDIPEGYCVPAAVAGIDFTCSATDYVVNSVVGSCTVTQGSGTCTVVAPTHLERISGSDPACTVVAGTTAEEAVATTGCAYSKVTTCPEPAVAEEVKVSGAGVVAPLAAVAAVLAALS